MYEELFIHILNTFVFSSGRVTDPDPLNFLDYIKRIPTMLFLKISGFLVFLALDITKPLFKWRTSNT